MLSHLLGSQNTAGFSDNCDPFAWMTVCRLAHRHVYRNAHRHAPGMRHTVQKLSSRCLYPCARHLGDPDLDPRRNQFWAGSQKTSGLGTRLTLRARCIRCVPELACVLRCAALQASRRADGCPCGCASLRRAALLSTAALCCAAWCCVVLRCMRMLRGAAQRCAVSGRMVSVCCFFLGA